MKQTEDKIINWIKNQVNNANCKGVVLGLSGGIDSSVVGILCKKAFPNNIQGIILPCLSNPLDLEHAKLLAEKFDIPYKIIELSSIFQSFFKELEGKVFEEGKKLEIVNLKPRLRMAALYYFANKLNYLVVGTDNKSEGYAGYFTKYGDGGVDILPIADLLKKDVRKLASHVGVHDVIINKAPSAGLWQDQTDESELGITYDQLDEILECIEKGNTNSCDSAILKKVQDLIQKTEHKRRVPPQCKIN